MQLVLYLAFLLPLAHCANILGLFLYPCYSHQIVYQKIYRELSLRGHQVTVLTTDPLNDPKLKNLTEIDLSYIYDIVKKNGYDKSVVQGVGPTKAFKELWELNYLVAEKLLNSTVVKNLLWNDNLVFDLVLRESLNPVTLAFAHKFGSPVIDISATDVFSISNDRVGNPNHPVLYPEYYFDFVPGKLSIWQKYQSVYFFLWHKHYYHNIMMPRFDQLARDYLDYDFPYLGDLEINISMFFINRNFMLHPPRPNVPAVVEISPVESAVSTPLSKSLQQFLDGSKQGVIYVSFGSQIKSTFLDKQFVSTLMQAFSELPYRFLVKWETDFLSGKPSNVLLKKWFPQKEVLGHPNVKAFITQGGQQSVEEGILKKVPMIGIPFGLDQPKNVRRVVELQIGERIDPDSLDKVTLKSLITKVAESKIYRDNMDEVQDLLTDKPMSGLDSAVWWAEYVIRHIGARHLRCAAVDMPWYQYLLLDVIGALLSGSLLTIYVIYRLFSLIAGLFKKKSDKKVKQN